MNITIKNNRFGKSKNKVFEQVTLKYLFDLLGSGAFKVKSVQVVFKSLKTTRYGYCRPSLRCLPSEFTAQNRTFEYVNEQHYTIALNSNRTLEECLKTLAHECVHVKQFALGELHYKAELTQRGRRQNIKIWKNREIKRKKYEKRAWEREARSKEGKLLKAFKRYYGDLKRQRRISG